MNSTRTNRTAARSRGGENLLSDFEQINYEGSVRLMSIAEFVRHSAPDLEMDNVIRFGITAGRAADGLQLAYMTRKTSGSLAVERILPEPLLRRVYSVMAHAHGWKPLAAPAALLPARFNDVVDHLTAMEAAARDAEVRQAIGIVIDTIENDPSQFVVAPTTGSA